MSNLKKIVFSMLAFPLLAIAMNEDLLFINYHIHIASGSPSDLPPGDRPLLVHCKSADIDLGYRAVTEQEDYTWDTKINLFRTTLFYCNVWWEEKARHFEAFKALRDEHRCREYHNSCMWSVRKDGIYFSNDNSTWINEYPW